MLSSGERRLLLAIAEAALPAGRVFPAAGEREVDAVDAYLAALPLPAQRAYRALVRAVDTWSLLRHRRRFTSLPAETRLAVLESWRRGGVARRHGLRAVLTPLKLAHFADPAFYAAVGCVYERVPPAPENEPRYMRERVHAAPELGESLEIECDAVVIGSGAGGAVVARELAASGAAVVVLEEGGYFKRQHFNGKPFEMQRKMYKNAGLTFAVGNTGIAIPFGRTVGGSTTINSGTCYRAPERVLAKWRDQLGLCDITADAMDGYYERVEQVLRVETAKAAHLGGVARVIARGCDALGITRHGPLRRNAPDCDGKGVCCFGCPTDAKRSTNVSYVPLALKAGAELFTGAKVTRILTEGGRAVGVVARAGDHELTVRARAVVVSCGAFGTPLLLERSGLAGASGQLGRNLSIHPAAACAGVFDETIDALNAIPQGYAIEEFHDEGILFEGASAPLEILMVAAPQVGPELIEMGEAFDRTALFGFMVEDTSRGRVRSVRGQPAITYVVNDRDLARLKRGVDILCRVLLAAGADHVRTPIHGFDVIANHQQLAHFRRSRVKARDFDLSAYHPLGTARMGADPRSSVIDENNEAHDVPGLFVVDGASVPTSLAVNPQVTIMALATRAAERIARKLG